MIDEPSVSSEMTMTTLHDRDDRTSSFAEWIKLQIPGDHDPPSYYTFSVAQCCMNEDGTPSQENLEYWVTRTLGDLCQGRTPTLQYRDGEGDLVVLPRGDDGAFSRALEQYPGKSLKIEAVFPETTNPKNLNSASILTACSVPSLLKLSLGDTDSKCRRISTSRIFQDSPNAGKELLPSLKKLKELASELANDNPENLSLSYNTLDGANVTLNSDFDLLDAFDHAPSAVALQPSVLKIRVQIAAKSRQIRLICRGQSLLFDKRDLFDEQKQKMTYVKLIVKIKSVLGSSSPGQLLVFYSESRKKMPTVIRNDRDLQVFLGKHAQKGDLEIVCQLNPVGFLHIVGVVALIAIGLELSLRFLPGQTNAPVAASNDYSRGSFNKDEIWNITLSPLNATVVGRYANVRKNPLPHVLFYDKSNFATWDLPNDRLMPGRYLVSSKLSRKTGTTFIHIGATSENDGKSAFEYRELFQNNRMVHPTGSWNRFSERYLGELELSGEDGEKLIVVADSKIPNVDFQDIALVRVGSRPMN